MIVTLPRGLERCLNAAHTIEHEESWDSRDFSFTYRFRLHGPRFPSRHDFTTTLSYNRGQELARLLGIDVFYRNREGGLSRHKADPDPRKDSHAGS